MALLTAYAKLQLDPNDHSRMATFETLCWHHILNHASHDWATACWEGRIKLQLWTSKTPSTQGFKSFDSTLNHLVFEFVQAYAAAIWPADDSKRSHLARVDTRHQGMELKALHWQLSVSNGTKQRFKATQNLDLTAEDVMVESKIGQRVRTYLMDLLLFKQPAPLAQSADAPTLLRNLLLPRTRKRARSGPASTATGALTFHNLPIALKRSKKEQQYAPEKASRLRHEDAVPKRTARLVRLRFTFSGARRAQSITTRPSQPVVNHTKSSHALNKAVCLLSTSSGTQSTQRNTATGAYQCLLRDCGEVFRTTDEVILHVNQKHLAESRELKMVSIFSDAVTDSTSQYQPNTPEPSLQVEPSDTGLSEARNVPEQSLSIGANMLLQSLQDAEKSGFTFDDEYIALVHRYTHA